jgi:signal transduction histidine kinase
LVIPLSPESGPRALVTLASRRDGLPYTDQQERMLESLLHVATTALDAAATAEDLGLRVNEKTASLERALSDRKHVLEAARTICEAERPEEILACVEDFPAAEGGHVSWDDAWESDRGDRLMSRLPIDGQPDRFLLVEALPPERLADLRPQLETLCTFARLALARLELLSELKREVDRQAAEIADITSRRLHAEFVRGVAHELRKPTEEVRQRVEVLLQGGSDAQEQTLARIRVATQEMSRRLDLLLFHSGLRLDRQRIDLVRVIDDAIHGARVMCPDRDFQVDHERSRLPMIGDPTRLLSVIENLLDNAIHATREGQRIAIRTWIERQDSGEGSWACLEVEDEGTGIQEEHIEQIFEPGIGFTPSGFGLGLSLCRAIVRMHGGRIATQSQPGRTIFRVHLPQFPHIPEESESDDSCHPAG